MTEKSYKNLQEEVWEKNLCSGCGACVAVCPADAIIFSDENDRQVPVQTGYCKFERDGVSCGACYAVCPRSREHREEREAKTGIGDYLELLAGRAVIDVEKKQSGGAVTAILSAALEAGVIDAVLTITEDPWTLRPECALISDREVLISHAGSRYSWWVPVLASLKEAVITRKYKNIAIVGVPCVASAARIMKTSNHDFLRPYGKAIRCIIGLFCTESFDYEHLVKDKLVKEHAISPWEIKRMDVRGKLLIERFDDEPLELPLRDLDTIVRPGCHACGDLTAVDADISAGSLGTPDGWTTLVVRTPTGAGFINTAKREELLETTTESIDLAPAIRLATVKAERLQKEPPAQ